MKQRIIAVLMAAAMTAGMITGCGSSELSNEYVAVKQYKGMEVPQSKAAEITDEQVEQAIQGNLENTATTSPAADRAAQNGDVVNINYTGTVDGVEFQGGSAENYDLELGSGSFIGANGDYKGFEEQIVGHNKGEEFDITVKFPDNYNPEMAGKVAVFHIVLNEISEKQVPELTDEWVKENSDSAETVDEYKKTVRKQLEDSAEESAEKALKASVQETLMKNVEIKKYPEEKVDKLVETLKGYYEQMAAVYGMELKDFIESYLQITEDEFNSQLKESAQQQVAIDEAVELIAKKEKLTPTEKEYEERIAEYAQEAGTDVESYKKQAGEDNLRDDVLRGVVTEFLVDECVQVEEEK